MARRTSLAGIFVLAILLIISVVYVDAGKSSRRGGSSGWGFKSRSTPKSKPQQHNQGGSRPGTIGWNVPSNNKPASSTIPKASAPNEHISRTSASNVNSGYPSGTHGNPPPYNPSYGHGGYNPSPGYGGHNPSPGYGGHNPSPGYGGHNPSSGYGVHNPSPGYGGYNPSSVHSGYNPSGAYPSGGYNPSYSSGHGFSNVPGQGYNPSYGSGHSLGSQPQTVIVQSQSSRPGIGQLAKEAFVFAGVSAGVNAAVNRILPGGIYGHSSVSNSGVVPPVSHTQITYNNYYNNGSEAQPAAPGAAPAAVPAAIPAAAPITTVADAPAANTASVPASSNNQPNQLAPPNNQQPNQQQSQQNNPGPSGTIISDAELQKLTENLFEKDTNNAFKYITIKTQGQKMDDSTKDDAPDNLLEVKAEGYEIPTIKAVLALHDNYEFDVRTKENLTPEKRKEESDLLDIVITTDVMKETMKFLADKGYVPNDEYEFKDSLKRIWFSQFKRVDGDATSSGFETVFLAEKFDNEIIGLHNWIYFAKQEEAKKLNYLGYIKKLDLGNNGAIIKGRSSLNDIVQPITTIFVGTSPELEMALYTICFYTRPNNACPITLGGANSLIVANRVNYFGKDILISAFPDI